MYRHSSRHARHVRAGVGSLVFSVCATSASGVRVDPIDVFDRAVAHGLPRTVTFADRGIRARDAAGGGQLTIIEALDVDVRFSDDSVATMYAARWDGAPAFVTRSADHLDITVTAPHGVRVTGFARDHAGSHAMELPGSPPDDAAARRSRRSVAIASPEGGETSSPSTQNPHEGVSTAGFYMYLHDDLRGVSEKHVHAGYVAWWVAGMRRTLAVSKIQAVYRRDIKGLTDLPYGYETALDDWTVAAEAQAERDGLLSVDGRAWFKHMLITSGMPLPGAHGQAWVRGDQAIASIRGPYSVIAHEFGHTLSASHEAAEIDWSNVWPCETNLYPYANALRSNCYRFTPANERRMRDYMAGAWHADPVGGKFEKVK